MELIQDSLVAGIIRPSSSPLGAGLFLVAEKDGTLRPCVDFQGLNNITIKNNLVMLFGLTNPSAVFQALVDDVLRDFLSLCT